ncbi:MAG: S41 family peptidase [Phycisphaerales bacterium]
MRSFDATRRSLVHTMIGVTLGATLSSSGLALEGNVDLPRYPSISPDGEQIVFSWRGDLWRVPFDGGFATRLTNHPGDDLESAWSPDGSTIAFGSNRVGSPNIYLMAPDGTNVRTVIEIDRGLALEAFGVDRDGAPVLTLTSYLEGDVYRAPRPYMVSVDGGDLERVHDAFGRSAVVSPDGARVAFVRGDSSWDRRHYRGPDNREVWLFDRADNSFTQLTDWAGNDGRPRWIDNDTLVFMSDRELDTVNLYRMELGAGGGPSITRLTSFEERDVADFGVSVDPPRAVMHVWDKLYTLDLSAGGAETRELPIYANEDTADNFELKSINREVSDAALSPDGQVMAYVAYGEVYVRNIEERSATRRVTNSHAHERDLAWSPDGLKLYFVSDRDGTDSIYAATVKLTRSELKEAFEEKTGVKLEDEDPDPAPEVDEPEADEDEDEPADDGDADAPADPISGSWSGSGFVEGMGESIPFTMDLALGENNVVTGSLDSAMHSGPLSGTFEPGSGTLELVFNADDGTTLDFSLTVSDGVMEGTATDGELVVRITANRTTGAGDATDDGGASDGETSSEDEPDEDLPPEYDPSRWHDAMRFTIEPVIQTEAHDRGPSPSPDGKSLAFRRGRGDLMVLDHETGETRRIAEGWDTGLDWRWSPDSRYLAYHQDDLDFNSDIWIARADGSTAPVNITRHPDNDFNPRWSLDGKIMSFISERVNEEYDLWMVYLDEDLEALTPKELAEYYDDQASAAKKLKPLETKPPKKEEDDDTDADDAEDGDGDGDADDDSEADDEDGSAEDDAEDDDGLELDTAYLRLQRVTSHMGGEFNNEMTPGGDFYIYTAGGEDAGLYSVKWDGSDRKRLTGSVNVQHLTQSGGQIVFTNGGRAGVIGVTGGSTDYYDLDDRIRIDLEEQSSQKFREAARILGERFYHPNMKGLEWDRLTEEYHELARNAHTGDEFNWVAARFLGELNASHLGVRAREFSSPNAEPYGRLGTIHRPVEGGYEVIEVIPDVPAAKGPMALRPGDIIRAIGLEPFEFGETIESRLRGRVNDEVIVTVWRTMDDGAMTELDLLVTTIPYGRERALKYEAWRNENARLVEEWSDGRLGYIHIQGMNQGSLDVFERDLYAAAHDKDGLIIDVRNNGGGWTTDRLLASITYPQHAYTVPRGADPNDQWHYPQDRLFIQRYTLPINTLCNEKSFSNAEIFSHAFKTIGRGTLVGQQTYGGVISTGGFSLIDGTFVRLPFRGWYLPDGTDMENHGAMPDLLVPQRPEAEADNADEQLRAAVDDLLDRLDEE